MSKVKNNYVKSKSEIEIMKKAGEICSYAMKKVLATVKVGAVCSELDNIAREEIEKAGATSSFMTVDDYKWTICTTINDQVVHGIPTETALKEGDILGVDIGACYKEYHSDMAISVPIGKIGTEDQKFLEIGKKTLKKAISAALIGNYIGDISQTIQDNIEGAGFSVVKNLTGHGIGKSLHEEPMVPGFGKRKTGPKIRKNMVLAIEVIYAKGSGEIKLEKDNWTISTRDGSLGGLFEQTVAITDKGPIVLTPYQ